MTAEKKGSVRALVLSGGRASGLTLRERGGVLEILAGNVVLLSSAALETERAFGRLAGALLDEPPRRVIVGGLGFGATLSGVLEAAAADARVTVVEKVPAVTELVAGELRRFDVDPLADPRVTVVHGDVADVLADAAAEAARSPGAAVDAILLDVDNGPHWASFRTNARLYAPAALAVARDALAPGGVFAVWSGYYAGSFRARLASVGLAPSVVPLRERGHVRARAYVGTKPRSGIRASP
jgi:spermidine synthase